MSLTDRHALSLPGPSVMGLHRVWEVVMRGSALVVGAGIGGLAAARGLLIAGWSVEVREQEAGPPGGGTALGMWPEAMRALDRLEIGDLLRAQAVQQRGASILRPNGSVLFELGSERRAHLVPRGALINALATGLPAGTIRWNCPVERPSGLPDVDVVVAADGIHSTVRAWESPATPRPLGSVAFRGTVPGKVSRVIETWGPGRLFGITPNGDHTTNWFACVRSSVLSSLDPGGSRAEVLRALYGTWHPAVTAVLDALRDEIDRRRLYDLPPLPSYVNGRTVLIGDAAHAMAPNLGRGACEALLDADTLVGALSQARHIEGGLAHYDAARRPATRRVVRRARLLNRISTATRTTRIRDAALTALGPVAPILDTGCRPAVRRAALVPTRCR
jgi:2-polyprenyl-6-methoxyphenol hydroxylase-like FAD-dependent oxidoreductase